MITFIFASLFELSRTTITILLNRSRDKKKSKRKEKPFKPFTCASMLRIAKQRSYEYFIGYQIISKDLYAYSDRELH